jgi:hypothetical protein
MFVYFFCFRSLGMQGTGVFPHQDLFLLGSKAEESPNAAAELCQQVTLLSPFFVMEVAAK